MNVRGKEKGKGRKDARDSYRRVIRNLLVLCNTPCINMYNNGLGYPAIQDVLYNWPQDPKEGWHGVQPATLIKYLHPYIAAEATIYREKKI